MDALESIEYKGHTINVYQDDNPDDPRNWDNLGQMLCFHNRYALGDRHNYDVEEVQEMMKRKDVIFLPLYLYDHSGISMSCSNSYPYNDVWDAGCVGIIMVDYATIRKEYHCKHVSSKLISKVITYLRNEVKTYDDYLTGQVYGYQVIDPDGDYLDSCWGFYGDIKDSGLLDESKSSIDYNTKQRESFVFAIEGIGL